MNWWRLAIHHQTDLAFFVISLGFFFDLKSFFHPFSFFGNKKSLSTTTTSSACYRVGYWINTQHNRENDSLDASVEQCGRLERKKIKKHTHTQRIKDDTQWFAVCVYPNQVIARVARRDASRSLSLLLLVISSLLFFYYPPFSVAGNGTRWFIFTNERDQWPPPICCRNESANEGRWTAGSWKKISYPGVSSFQASIL